MPPLVEAPVNGRWWSLAIASSLLAYGLAWWALDGYNRSQAQRVAEEAQARRDSVVSVLAARRAVDSARLVGWADSVVGARGDSLRALVASTAQRAVVRLPGHVRKIVERDTLRIPDTVWVPGSDLRVLVVSDSAQRVRGDSLQGELDQCAYDLREALDRPETQPRWSWSAFGLGVGVGSAGAAAACMLTR